MSTEVKRIKCKKVTRYYYNGRGYSNLFTACRVIAKNEFKDLVYGPQRDLVKEAINGLASRYDFGDVDAEEMYIAERIMLLSELVAVHFPHDETCLRPFFCSTQPKYPSCKPKIDAWINQRTRELMSEYKTKHIGVETK